MTPFPFEANGAQEIVESIEFLTDIIPAYDDSEQRVQIRGTPRRAIEYTALCMDARASGYADLLIYGLQHDLLGVGLWQYANRLTVSAGSGATNFTVATDDVPWAAGDTAFLFLDPFTWDALAFDHTTSGHVITSTASTRTWPIGTIVVPMRAGRVSSAVPYSHEARDLRELRIRFLLEPAV